MEKKDNYPNYYQLTCGRCSFVLKDSIKIISEKHYQQLEEHYLSLEKKHIMEKHPRKRLNLMLLDILKSKI